MTAPVVLIAGRRAGVGGAERVTAAVAAAARAAGLPTAVVVDEPGGAFADGDADAFDPAAMTAGLLVCNFSERAAAAVSRLPPAVRVVVILHTAVPWTFAFVDRLPAARVDLWWIVDAALRTALTARNIAPDRIRDLPVCAAAWFRPPDAIERARARVELGCGPGEKLIVYTGRPAPEKNPATLVRAVGALARRGVRARLHLVGGVDTAAADALFQVVRQWIVLLVAREAGTAVTTEPPGEAAVLRALHAADVAALASRFEGEPLTIVEAAACGVPWVAPPVGNVPRLHAETGLGVVPPRNGNDYTGADFNGFVDALAAACNARHAGGRRGRPWDATARETWAVLAAFGLIAPGAAPDLPAPVAPPPSAVTGRSPRRGVAWAVFRDALNELYLAVLARTGNPGERSAPRRAVVKALLAAVLLPAALGVPYIVLTPLLAAVEPLCRRIAGGGLSTGR